MLSKFKKLISLSKKNSNIVAALIEKGISEDRLSTVGYGENKPIESNETAKGRSMNRRVQINRSTQINLMQK